MERRVWVLWVAVLGGLVGLNPLVEEDDVILHAVMLIRRCRLTRLVGLIWLAVGLVWLVVGLVGLAAGWSPP